MKQNPILPDTIEGCHAMIIDLAQRIALLQRYTSSSSLNNRAIKYEGPSLFDDYDREAQQAATRSHDKASDEMKAMPRKTQQPAKKKTSRR